MWFRSPVYGKERGVDRPATPVRRIAGQAVLIGLAALLYFGVRGMTNERVGLAVENGQRILDLESALYLKWESAMQEAILDHGWLVDLANWVYIWGHWPFVIVTLFWLALRHPDEFVMLRNALFISGAIGLVIFLTFPVTPPRLLDIGLADTVTQKSSSYRAFQPPGLINKHAAMPSLHFGWNLLVGIAIYRATTSVILRVVAILVPAAMAIAVVITANHYVLDAIVGAIVALLGLWLVGPVNRTFARIRARSSG